MGVGLYSLKEVSEDNQEILSSSSYEFNRAGLGWGIGLISGADGEYSADLNEVWRGEKALGAGAFLSGEEGSDIGAGYKTYMKRGNIRIIPLRRVNPDSEYNEDEVLVLEVQKN